MIFPINSRTGLKEVINPPVSGVKCRSRKPIIGGLPLKARRGSLPLSVEPEITCKIDTNYICSRSIMLSQTLR